VKLPVAPTPWVQLLQRHASSLGNILAARLRPEPGGKYEHWDHLRHLSPPAGLSPEEWWVGIKFARHAIGRELALHDKAGKPFTMSLPDSMQRRLFLIARDAAGSIQGLERIEDDPSRERYLIRSLIEEAMTSSQLEGAATTTQVAKAMLKTGRQPRDYGERMIFNNYATMLELKRWLPQPLTPDMVFEMHRMLTQETLASDAAGRLRRSDEDIVVEDEAGNVLHVPPAASELPRRLQALCDFANSDDPEAFIHPVIRAIVIHFQIGYDHPFCDGNGRTARALFYWSMLRSGFWMTEYLSISSILRKAPSKYSRAFLFTESDESDVSYFIDHQLDVILSAIESLHGYLARKEEERTRVETLLKPGSRLAARINHRQRAVLLNALRHPDRHYTIEAHRRAHDVTYQTARTDLRGLVSAGLMEQHQQGRAFVFQAAPDLAGRLKH
jgi:Fic family protein